MNHEGAIISKLLRDLRADRAFSQSFIATALAIPLRTYQSWEKNYSSSAGNLFAICTLYQIPAETFFHSIEAAVKGMEISLAELSSVSISLANAAAEGASEEELIESFPSCFNGGKPETFITAAILDAYFSTTRVHDLVYAERIPSIETQLAKSYGLIPGSVRVIGTERLHFQCLKEIALGRFGAELIHEWSTDKPLFRLGISNGYTIARILDHIPRSSAFNLSLFPLNYTQTPVDFPITTTSLISSFQYRHEGRCAEYRPMNEKEVYSAMLLADAAILGIGTLRQQGLYSRMIRETLGTAYLDKLLVRGAIGDFNYYLMGKEGELLDFPELVAPLGEGNSTALIKSIELELLATKAGRACPIAVAAAGDHKAELVKQVLEKGFINSLVIDSSLAKNLL